MIELIAHCLHLVHNQAVRETSRAWFGDQTLQAGRAATFGGIFSSQAIAPSLGGVAGIPSGMPGTCSRFANPVIAAHPFGDGSGQPLLQEAIMAKSPSAPAHFPQHFEQSFHVGATCAAAWFRAPTTSLVKYRDTMRTWHVDRVIFSHEPGRIPMADAFDGFSAGFERGVAEQIAGGANHA